MAAFSLVYDKYVEKGMLQPNRYGLRVTEFHLLDTTTVYVAVREGQVIGTATLIGDGDLALPMDEVHPEITRNARHRGVSIGEATCLAIRSPHRIADLPVFIGLTRLMAQYARTQGLQQILLGCVPGHAKFYCRFLGFEQIGRVRPYPTVCNTLGVACRLDFERIDRDRPGNYDRYFGEPLPAQALINTPMSDFERRAFSSVLEHSHLSERQSA
jgi:hypothetical protein